MLSHLSRRCSEIPVLNLSEPLRALIMMGPWVSFSQDWDSTRRNLRKDIESTDALKRWAEVYLSGHVSDAYSEPLLADADWWNEIQVMDTLVVAGEDEIFVDAIIEWTKKFKVFLIF